MTDAAAADMADKKVDDTSADAGKEVDKAADAGKAAEQGKDKAQDADKGANATNAVDDAKATDEAAKGKDDKPKEFVADSTKTDAENEAARIEFDKAAEEEKGKKGLPDDWRDIAAAGDDDTLKLLKRYGSISGVAKALKEAQATIRGGKLKTTMPDPKDEKAMAEWRKAEGIPADPTGYKLPDEVVKRLTDEDKPILSSFTDYAHKRNARPDVVEIASSWYVEMEEMAAAKRLEEDSAASEEAEDALRKDWAHGEYKANTTIAKRFVESIPGVGESWSEARMPNGRRLGDIPEFVSWAADMGREKFGDAVFATPDGESRHNSRKAEIEKIRNEDFDRYEREGLDKEYRKIIERDLARAKR